MLQNALAYCTLIKIITSSSDMRKLGSIFEVGRTYVDMNTLLHTEQPDAEGSISPTF
jgi:hypothetical protein